MMPPIVAWGYFAAVDAGFSLGLIALSRRNLGIPGWGDCVRGYMSMQGKDK
jgi:hypothetical protein